MVGLEFHDFSQTLPMVLRPIVGMLDDKLKGSLSGFVGALLLRDYDVLVAFTEYNRNVIRLEPPLICQREHVDQFVDALDEPAGARHRVDRQGFREEPGRLMADTTMLTRAPRRSQRRRPAGRRRAVGSAAASMRASPCAIGVVGVFALRPADGVVGGGPARRQLGHAALSRGRRGRRLSGRRRRCTTMPTARSRPACPAGDYLALTDDGGGYRTRMANDAAAFHSMLPMYRVKFLYAEMLSGLSKVMPPVAAMQAVQVFSALLFGAVVLLWLRSAGALALAPVLAARADRCRIRLCGAQQHARPAVPRRCCSAGSMPIRGGSEVAPPSCCSWP